MHNILWCANQRTLHRALEILTLNMATNQSYDMSPLAQDIQKKSVSSGASRSLYSTIDRPEKGSFCRISRCLGG